MIPSRESICILQECGLTTGAEPVEYVDNAVEVAYLIVGQVPSVLAVKETVLDYIAQYFYPAGISQLPGEGFYFVAYGLCRIDIGFYLGNRSKLEPFVVVRVAVTKSTPVPRTVPGGSNQQGGTAAFTRWSYGANFVGVCLQVADINCKACFSDSRRMCHSATSSFNYSPMLAAWASESLSAGMV